MTTVMNSPDKYLIQIFQTLSTSELIRVCKSNRHYQNVMLNSDLIKERLIKFRGEPTDWPTYLLNVVRRIDATSVSETNWDHFIHLVSTEWIVNNLEEFRCNYKIFTSQSAMNAIRAVLQNVKHFTFIGPTIYNCFDLVRCAWRHESLHISKTEFIVPISTYFAF